MHPGVGTFVLIRPAQTFCERINKELYKRRNEVERLVRRLKGFRRIFSRFDKLDVLFLGFILVALIFDALRSVNTP